MDTGALCMALVVYFYVPPNTELGSSSCSRNSSPPLQQALHTEPVIFQSPAPNANHCTIDSPRSLWLCINMESVFKYFQMWSFGFNSELFHYPVYFVIIIVSEFVLCDRVDNIM